jgi:ABC-2 type transport system ATP-binding protein
VQGSPARATLSAVRKRFGRRAAWVLDGIDLELPPGSTTVVIGANGSGKSTLLRVAAGLSAPTVGRVERGSATMGYAPDRLGARVRMSGRVYVEHMARIRAADVHDARSRADEMFERLELRPGPDAPIASLSKGNAQKVALVQALMLPVDLLILDEPYGGLDPTARDAVSEIIAERVARGATALVSAHAPLDFGAGAATLHLDHGRLRTSTRARTTTRVVLADRDGPGAPDGFRSRPGVATTHADGTTLVLAIEAGAVDHVLAAALSAGWSVISVTPANSGPARD